MLEMIGIVRQVQTSPTRTGSHRIPFPPASFSRRSRRARGAKHRGRPMIRVVRSAARLAAAIVGPAPRAAAREMSPREISEWRSASVRRRDLRDGPLATAVPARPRSHTSMGTRIIARLRWHLHELDPGWTPPTKLERDSAFDKVHAHLSRRNAGRPRHFSGTTRRAMRRGHSGESRSGLHHDVAPGLGLAVPPAAPHQQADGRAGQ